MAGCAGPGSSPDPDSTATPRPDDSALPDEVTPLAKTEGWREGFEQDQMPFGLVEVAEDAETAQRAWQERTSPNRWETRTAQSVSRVGTEPWRMSISTGKR